MTSVGRAAVVVLFAALLFIGVGWHLQIGMERKLEELGEQLTALAQEHAAALEAAAQAARMREAIYEETAARESALQSALRDNDFGSLLLPPELRAILSGNNQCQSANASAGADSAAEPRQP